MSGLFFNTFELALVAAPWLVLGLVCAGLLRGLVPPRLVGPALGGSGFIPVLRAAIVGAPLPLCSCGVLPTAFALRVCEKFGRRRERVGWRARRGVWRENEGAWLAK